LWLRGYGEEINFQEREELEMGRGLSVFRRDGLMACGEKNERKVVRRGDGRWVAEVHVSSAEVKWSGREDIVFNGRKIQRGGLSVAVFCLQLSLLVMGKKAMGLNGIWLPNESNVFQPYYIRLIALVYIAIGYKGLIQLCFYRDLL